MRQPIVDDFVRLTQDLPELALSRGEVGIVRSTWFNPSVAYEVEFHRVGQLHQMRTLLMPDQIELQDGPLLAQATVEEGTSPFTLG